MKFFLCKKQYVYISLVALSIGLAITSHVSAQETTDMEEALDTQSVERERIREPREVPIETMRTQREGTAERIEERRAALKENVQNRLINLARNMTERMQAAIERIDQITTRVESRIAKLKEKGVDTGTAEDALARSKDAHEKARALLSDIDEAMVDAITSDNPREEFRNVRPTFIEARDALKEARTHLRTVITALREASGSLIQRDVREEGVEVDVGEETATPTEE